VSDKYVALLELARRRQAARWPGYGCIGDYHGGVYECDFVSPYSKSASNADASLMVLLQDWASADSLQGPVPRERILLGHDPMRRTNTRLKQLLRKDFQLELQDIYATNVFPFIKEGAIGATIPMRDLIRAAKEFALPQIMIIKPVVAVCLGKAAYNAVARAAGRQPAPTLANAVATPFTVGQTQVWCQPHPGRNGVDLVGRDWERMAAAFKSELRRRARLAGNAPHAED